MKRGIDFKIILLANILTLVPITSMAQRKGGGDAGGGAGVLVQGRVVPMSQVPGLVSSQPPEQLVTISAELRELALQYTEVFRPLLAPRVFESLQTAVAKREYLQTLKIPDEYLQKIENEYKEVLEKSKSGSNKTLKIVAYTKENRTYFTKDFLKMDPINQVIFMFHEAHYALDPKATLAEVLMFEKAVSQMLIDSTSIDNQIDFAISYPTSILSDQSRFAIMVRAFEMAGQPIRLSELFDTTMTAEVALTPTSCERGGRPDNRFLLRNYGNVSNIGEHEEQRRREKAKTEKHAFAYRPGVDQYVQLQNRNAKFALFLREKMSAPAAKLALVDRFYSTSIWPQGQYTGGLIPIECEYVNPKFENFVLRFKMWDPSSAPNALKRAMMSQVYGENIREDYYKSHMQGGFPMVVLEAIDGKPTEFVPVFEASVLQTGRGFLEMLPPHVELNVFPRQ